MADSDVDRTGPSRVGDAVELAEIASIDVGGAFRGDLGLDRNMLSVVVARVIDRFWNVRDTENGFEERGSGDGFVGEMGEKVEGDIGGLISRDTVANCTRSEGEVGEPVELGSGRSSSIFVGSAISILAQTITSIVNELSCRV